jgi:hypothetical protein
MKEVKNMTNITEVPKDIVETVIQNLEQLRLLIEDDKPYRAFELARNIGEYLVKEHENRKGIASQPTPRVEDPIDNSDEGDKKSIKKN